MLTGAGAVEYDEVVLATHADASLRLLMNPSIAERRLLGAWSYQDNPVTLHHDTSVLHTEPKLWGSWNMRREADGEGYRISYYLNRLQSLQTRKPVILTLGDVSLDSSSVVKKFNYRHPVFTAPSVATQTSLDSLNGVDRIYYCGSYFGYGFHEDAVRSAVNVAARFGVCFGQD